MHRGAPGDELDRHLGYPVGCPLPGGNRLAVKRLGAGQIIVSGLARDSKRLAHHWEEEFANNPNYVEMFRRGNAYHGVHPFYMWYWAENGQHHVGDVIVVGAENDHVPARLGWRTARTMDEALDMARDNHGPSPEITLMHHPPFLVADVK